MPNAFNFSESPFDCLSPEEQGLVRNSVDIAYFRAGETILDVGVKPTHLFVVIKGVVQQYDGTEVIHSYGVNDCFDGRGLVAEKVSSRFVAAEEVVAYQLAREAVSSLIASNATFGAMLFSDLSNKLSAHLATQEPARAAVADDGARRRGLRAAGPLRGRRYRHRVGRQAVPGGAHDDRAGARSVERIRRASASSPIPGCSAPS